MSSALASRYARALADAVLAPASSVAANLVAGQLLAVEGLLAESADLRIALESPAVSNARKRAVLSNFSQTLRLSREIKNLLFVMVDRRRIGQLSAIRQAFEAILDERQGLVRAEVASASELDSGQRTALEQQLARLSGKQVRASYAVDSTLLGGVTARIGSTVYDGSVRGQLDGLRRRLTGGL